MRFPGEPTLAQSTETEQRFREWCRENRLDPEATASAVAYEQWWDETFPPGEEEQWPY